MKRILFLALGAAIFASCDTSLDVGGVPEFEVTIEKNTYKVGEEVIFNINGSPRILNFYSGELGNDYDFKEGRILPPGNVEFSFEMRYQYPARTSAKIRVKTATNFNGNRSSFEDVDAADWTDITDKFVINKVSEAYAPSGVVDVTEFVEDGKPIYFAFEYEFDPSSGTGTGPIIWIRDVKVATVTAVGRKAFTNSLTDDFLAYSTGNADKNPKRSDNRGTSLVMWPNIVATVDGIPYTNKTYTKEYFVTKGYNVSERLDVGPDKPLTLKGYSDSRVDSHVHVFSKPGVYKVKFVGLNHSINETKESVKEIVITVTE